MRRQKPSKARKREGETQVAIIAKDNGGEGYPLVPADTYAAVCVDVEDLGMKKSTFEGKEKTQHKVALWWQIDCERPDKAGERFTVRKWYTLSLNEKSSLSKDLTAWRGRAFTKEEREGFDVETLIGVPAMLSIIHKNAPDGSKTYANIASIARLPKGMAKLSPHAYVRRKDREGAQYDKAREEDMAQDVQYDADGQEIPFALLVTIGSGLLAGALSLFPLTQHMV